MKSPTLAAGAPASYESPAASRCASDVHARFALGCVLSMFFLMSKPDRALFSCPWMLPLELYSVSIPSGIITTSEVPTKTPVPRAVMNRNCRFDRANESGRRPASMELDQVSMRKSHLAQRPLGWIQLSTYAVAMTTHSSSSIKKPSHMTAMPAIHAERAVLEKGRVAVYNICAGIE